MRLTTQVNLPKMKEGGLDVSFMIVYVGAGAASTPEGYESAYDAGGREVRRGPPADEQLAPNRDWPRADAGRRRPDRRVRTKVAVIGVENGYPIGTDIERVKEFYDRGGRYMSLAHNGHSQLSDSNTGEANNSGRTAA